MEKINVPVFKYDPMKRNHILFLLLLFFLTTPYLYSQPAFPPIGSQPVWRVNWTSVGGFSGQDVFTYGDSYCRCGYTYVAVIRNGNEELMYIRMTEDEVFYRLDLEACGEERMLYDFSLDETTTVPVRTGQDDLDAFQEVTVVYEGDGQDNMFLGGPFKQIAYQYEWGPFNFSQISLWYRGIGDLFHPFYPLLNNFNPGQEIVYAFHSLEVDHLTWFCTNENECGLNPVVFVDQDVVGGQQDGSSWVDAYSNLEVALNAADSGAVLWVAEGLYRPTTTDDRGRSFVVRNGVSVYGGFSGAESFFLERDPVAHSTILSGDIGVPGDSTDNTFHVIRIQDVYHFAVLDGLTIQDGNAVGGGLAFPFVEDGGGVIIYAAFESAEVADIQLTRCLFTQNEANSGGALAINDHYAVNSRLAIQSSIFMENSANWGACFHVPENIGNPIDIAITQSSLNTNHAKMGGGGVAFDRSGLVNWQIEDSDFISNRVIGGSGGVLSLEYSVGEKTITVKRSGFIDNFCPGDGGAIGVFHAYGSGSLTIELEKSDFISNESAAGAGGTLSIGSYDPCAIQVSAKDCLFAGNRSADRGGNIAIRTEGAGGDGILTIDRCTFLDNSSWSNIGGALRLLVNTPISDGITPKILEVKIKNSLFAGNRGTISQAVLSNEVGVRDSIFNCTFVDNGLISISKNFSENYDGEQFFNDMYIHNSIIWEPEIDLWQTLYNGEIDPVTLYDFELDHCLISTDSCDLPGGEAACNTHLNYFNLNPFFQDAENGNYSLAGCSPALNAGSLTDIQIGVSDLSGNERIREELIDLGAYEGASLLLRVDSLVDQLACFGDATGTIQLSAEQAIAPISYTLFNSDGNELVENSGGLFTGLAANEYLAVFQDAATCIDSIAFSIAVPQPIAVFLSVQDYFSETEAGAISIDSIVGGNAPYYVTFAGEPLEMNEISNLSPGFYQLLVTDAFDCLLDSLIEIRLIDNWHDLGKEETIFTIFPNPILSGQHLAITNEDLPQTAYSAEILDPLGRILKKFSWSQRHTNVYLPSTWAGGVYFLIIRNSGGAIISTQRLVVH